jgi:DNA-binding CsgD family transcriptional regulator
MKHPDFLTYLEKAKHSLEHERVPNFDSYFTNLNSFNPLFNHLDNILFVLDFRVGKFLYIGPNSNSVQGYTDEEIIKLGPFKALELYHPSDAEIVVNTFFVEGNEALIKHPGLDFSKAKISYNYRLRQKDESYKMLLQQFSILMVDAENNPLIILGTISNIDELHIGNELFCKVSVLNKSGTWNSIFERHIPITSGEKEFNLTEKEIEIIKFINKGMSSKEIANLTSRSAETIKVQRKKILDKTGCVSMNEVIALANKNGWV